MQTIYTYTKTQDIDISIKRRKPTYGLTSSRHPHSLRQKESKGFTWEGPKWNIDRMGKVELISVAQVKLRMALFGYKVQKGLCWGDLAKGDCDHEALEGKGAWEG